MFLSKISLLIPIGYIFEQFLLWIKPALGIPSFGLIFLYLTLVFIIEMHSLSDNIIHSFWLHAFNFVSCMSSFEGRVDFTSLIGCCEFKVLQALNLFPFPLARSMPLHPFLYNASLHRLAPLLCFGFWLWFSRLCEFLAECGSWSRGWETAGNLVACAPPHSCLCKGAPGSVCFLLLSLKLSRSVLG